MRPIDADNLRGRVCEIFLCAEPGSAEGRGGRAGQHVARLPELQSLQGQFDRGESNQQDPDRLKRAIPAVMKECCTEKQALYITRFFADGMKMKDIAAFYGVNKSVVSRTINRGLENLYDYLRFCSPDLVACAKRKGRITQKKVGGT